MKPITRRTALALPALPLIRRDEPCIVEDCDRESVDKWPAKNVQPSLRWLRLCREYGDVPGPYAEHWECR
jgi:hypothetical protein